jgi:hypothetical protein
MMVKKADMPTKYATFNVLFFMRHTSNLPILQLGIVHQIMRPGEPSYGFPDPAGVYGDVHLEIRPRGVPATLLDLFRAVDLLAEPGVNVLHIKVMIGHTVSDKE